MPRGRRGDRGGGCCGRGSRQKVRGGQNITFRIEKDGSEIEVVGGEIAPDDSGICTTEKGVFRFYGDELVGYAFDSETREAMREFFDTAFWC